MTNHYTAETSIMQVCRFMGDAVNYSSVYLLNFYAQYIKDQSEIDEHATGCFKTVE